jgi:hypothetical protein
VARRTLPEPPVPSRRRSAATACHRGRATDRGGRRRTRATSSSSSVARRRPGRRASVRGFRRGRTARGRRRTRDEGLVHLERLPARAGEPVPFPDDLPETLRGRLEHAGIHQLWSHQAAAWSRARAGEHLVVATGTASGKSLCYQLPVFDRLLADDKAVALYLAPTKALAHDQLRSLRGFRLPQVRAAAIDGDTPPPEREAIRRTANWVLTNPDLLHHGLLPNHRSWRDLLHRLAFVVIDESHVARGVFGGHVALVLRRLRRLAERYGADPTFLLTSATIGNPGEHASTLTGLEVAELTRDGSPRGPLDLGLWQPPFVDDPGWDPELGLDGAPTARRSLLRETGDLLASFVAADVQTLVFTRSRKGAEVTAVVARERLGDATTPDGVRLADTVAAYRAGYLADERRDLETRLRSGALRGVAATSALELGIDVAGLDAVVLAGWPGTSASFWQRLGRAGRAGRRRRRGARGPGGPARPLPRRPPGGAARTTARGRHRRPDQPLPAGAAPALRVPGSPAHRRGGDRLVRRDRTGRAGRGRRRRAAPAPRRPALLDLPPPRRRRGRPALGRGRHRPDRGRRHGRARRRRRRGPSPPAGPRGCRLPPPGAAVRGPHPRPRPARGARDGGTPARAHHPAPFRHRRAGAGGARVGRVGRGHGGARPRRGDDPGDRLRGAPARLRRGPRPDRARSPADRARHGRGLVRRARGPADHGRAVPRGRARVAARRRARRHRDAAAARAVRPLGPRGAVHGAAPRHGGADGLRLRRLPRGAGLAERSFRRFAEHQARTRETIATCRCRSGCPSCVQSPKCGNGNDPLDKRGAVQVLDLLLARAPS